MNEAMRSKLSSELQEMITEGSVPDPVKVIIQTRDGLKDADKQMLDNVGGELVDDLWIIKGFSAKIPARGLEMVVMPERVTQVHHDREVG